MNVYIKKQNFLWQKTLLGIIVFSFLIICLNIFQYPIKNSFYLISAPLQKAGWRAGQSMHGAISSFLEFKGLKKENNNLKEENQTLLSQIALLQQTVKEHQAVTEVLPHTQADKFNVILAEVIGMDSVSDSMLINKGSDDGITEYMAVISPQKSLYGKVFKVYKNFSKVMLISHQQSVVDVKIQQSDPLKTPVYGAVKGEGSLSVYLDLIPLEAELKEGDILTTSGLEGFFPKNLLVGKITANDKNDLHPYQTAQVKPFFDIKNIDTVFIITDYKKAQ